MDAAAETAVAIAEDEAVAAAVDETADLKATLAPMTTAQRWTAAADVLALMVALLAFVATMTADPRNDAAVAATALGAVVELVRVYRHLTGDV